MFYNPPMATDSPTVRTRFAPSPTGELHIGGARTALFNWAFARQHSGEFVLRVEDTDRKRSSDQATENILRDLEWLGLDHDGEVAYQSQRLELYTAAVAKLKAAGRAYDDDGAVRFKTPDHDVTVRDAVLGDVVTPASELEDFVIQKADGYPTFHLANVVDDADMGITHVIRGADHLTNTAKHVALQEALELETPIYVHIPLIFNPDGSKMSKRDKAKTARKAAQDQELSADKLDGGIEADAFAAFLAKESDDLSVAIAIAKQLDVDLPEIDVADFKAAGYLPAPLINYLALLGWNPGGDVEQFGLDSWSFLKEHISLERVQKGSAKFDREKLAAFNQEAIKELLSPEQRVSLLQDYAPQHFPAFMDCLDDQTWPAFAEAYRERAKTLRDPFVAGAFFVMDDDAVLVDTDFDSKGMKKALFKGDPNGTASLEAFLPTLEGLDKQAWSGQAAHDLIASYCEKNELNMGKVAQPIRVAVSGGTVTPPLELTLEILGREKTLARIGGLLERVRELELI